MRTPLSSVPVDAYAGWSPGKVQGAFGHAQRSPSDRVVAGTHATWRVRFHAGRYGVTRQGRVALVMKAVSNWADLQVTEPAAANHASVFCSNEEARVRLVWEPLSGIWAW